MSCSPFSRFGALGASITVLVITSASAAQPVSNSRAWVGPRLSKALQDPVPAESIAIRVTLKRNDLDPPGLARRASVHARQNRTLGALAPGTFQMTYRYESVSGFAGRAQASAINALLRHAEVTAIHLDYLVHATLAQGVALIGADLAHSAGLTGSGVNVALLDTQQSGIGSAEDDNGHGTHTAGIITSAGVVAAPGVAPDAGIVAIKVLNAAGSGFSSSTDAALDWLVTNHQALGVRVVNVSLSDGGEYNNPLASPCSGTPSANAVALLHAAGVVVFAASGNDGYDDGISAPACIPEAISVGGVYDASAGNISWCGNSSCTTILCTDATGPDVFVCHSNSDEILDMLAPNWRTTSPDMGGGVSNFGGTSASSPYAAGQAALLLQDEPSLQPESIRDLLTENGPLVTNQESGLSFPRSNVGTALGLPEPSSTLLLLSGATFLAFLDRRRHAPT